jgi:hypothetical protein
MFIVKLDKVWRKYAEAFLNSHFIPYLIVAEDLNTDLGIFNKDVLYWLK